MTPVLVLAGEPVRLVTGDPAPAAGATAGPSLLGIPFAWWLVIASAAVLLAGVAFLALTRARERRDPEGAAARGLARSLGLGRRDLVLLDEIARRTNLGTPLEMLLSVKRLERAAERFAQVEGTQAPRRRLFDLCRRLDIAIPAALSVEPSGREPAKVGPAASARRGALPASKGR